MIRIHLENILLKITIGIFLFLSLSQCKKEIQLTNISEADNELLKTIDNSINNDFNAANILIDSLIETAKASNDKLLLANGYLRRGVVLTKKGEFNNSIDTLKSGVDIIRNYEDLPIKNLFLLRIGNNYALDDKSEIALNYYLTVYEDAVEKNNAEHVFKASVNIAKIRRNAGKFEDALLKYKTAYEQTKKLKVSPQNEARVLMGVGGTYLRLQQPDSALFYSEKGFKISQQINDKSGESYFNNDFGIAYFLKEDYETSLKFLKETKVYIDSIGNDKRLSEAVFYTGACYYKMQDYTKAIDNLETVIRIVNKSEKLDNKKFRPLFLENTYDFLSKCYLAIGNKEASNNYENLHDELVMLRNRENNKIVDALHESELRINNDFIEKTLSDNVKKVNRYRYVSILVALLCLASIYLLLHYKKEAKKNKEIFEALISEKRDESKTKQSTVTITDNKVNEVLQKLEKIEKQDYYLDSNCTLATLAKKAKTNTTYLSKILKEHKGKTFYTYLNELRINYAINRLKTNKQFRRYAIKHIAKEVGYKSPESFTKHFKKATGIYPSYYIKELEKITN